MKGACVIQVYEWHSQYFVLFFRFLSKIVVKTSIAILLILLLCPLFSCFSLLKQQLSLLPLMEPLIGVNFAHFAPYGSGQLNGENLLSGTFGSASLDGVSDYYSQLAYKVRAPYLTK